MKDKKKYKVIIPYTESSHSLKKFKIEYIETASNRSEAIEKAEKEFNAYSQNNSASWIRILDPSELRAWRVFPDDPNTPQFIDELIESIPCKAADETIKVLKRLGELEDASASSKIISLTKLDNTEIVVNAINALGNIGDPTILFAVKNTYFQKDDAKVKLAIVNNLLKLALPEDNLTDFYLTAIKDSDTRKAVFKLENACLIPVWLAELSTDEEFETVKKAVLKLGEKALKVLVALNNSHPKINSYALQLVKILKPIAIESQWEDWDKAADKYKL